MVVKEAAEELPQELLSGKTLGECLRSPSVCFIRYDLGEHWHRLITQSGMKNADIIARSEFSYVYFYDVISGRKIPTKDKIIRLILAMNASYEACQESLLMCGWSTLSPRIRRDYILLYAVLHKFSVQQAASYLHTENEPPLK